MDLEADSDFLFERSRVLYIFLVWFSESGAAAAFLAHISSTINITTAMVFSFPRNDSVISWMVDKSTKRGEQRLVGNTLDTWFQNDSGKFDLLIDGC